jgi:hypothetical protein
MVNHTPRSTWAALCAATMLLSVSAVDPQAASRLDGLTIRVYDMAQVDPRERADAIKQANEILADAGVMVDWRDCGRRADGEPAGCEVHRGRADLVIRVMHGGLDSDTEMAHALGFSVVEANTGAGALATVFVNRVEPVARRAGADRATLLGRTIAHEVGHLLLGTNEHSEEGLMRELWTDVELARNRRQDWVFAPEDRQRLRAILQQDVQTATRLISR